MADILVTWYSRSGSTEAVARALAERLGADARPILTSASYAGTGGFLRGVWDSLRRRGPDVAVEADPGAYRLVVVGGPIWAGKPAAPLRSFLRRDGPRAKAVAAFCVSGSGGAYPAAFAEIEDLVGSRLVATLSLAQNEALGEGVGEVLDEFARELRGLQPMAA
ncbi:flavodoxin family protein [Brevundimonas sp.]|uniref:flavodoxin family protein n=1 Tax=Brevundimonas sp. TaxID=1871086 RepID=UPI0035B0CAB3